MRRISLTKLSKKQLVHYVGKRLNLDVNKETKDDLVCCLNLMGIVDISIETVEKIDRELKLLH